MKISSIATLFAICCTLPVTAQDEYLADTLTFRLANGVVIRHDQYEGALRRFDGTGRQTARASLPKSTIIDKRTRVAVSAGESRLLIVHTDESSRLGRGVQIVDSTTLREIADLPLGDCNFLQFPGHRALPEQVALLCKVSPDPADGKKRTFAFVTLDVNAAKVARWFDLGGQRHRVGWGPLTFAYADDTFFLRVKRDGCENILAADGQRVVVFDVDDARTEIIVLIKRPDIRSLVGTGELWFAGPTPADIPKRIAAFAKRPESARLCGDELTVVFED